MKLASLLLVVIGLSSCVAKPWMVGSVNEQIKPGCLRKYHKNSGSSSDAAPGGSGDLINPVVSGPMNPVH